MHIHTGTSTFDVSTYVYQWYQWYRDGPVYGPLYLSIYRDDLSFLSLLGLWAHARLLQLLSFFLFDDYSLPALKVAHLFRVKSQFFTLLRSFRLLRHSDEFAPPQLVVTLFLQSSLQSCVFVGVLCGSWIFGHCHSPCPRAWFGPAPGAQTRSTGQRGINTFRRRVCN